MAKNNSSRAEGIFLHWSQNIGGSKQKLVPVAETDEKPRQV